MGGGYQKTKKKKNKKLFLCTVYINVTYLQSKYPDEKNESLLYDILYIKRKRIDLQEDDAFIK